MLTRKQRELLKFIQERLAQAMPRWAELVDAQRKKLSEALERAEYALVRDERELENAQDRLQQARAELTRAVAREDGIVYHTYSTYARGLDSLWGMYQWLDRAPKGRNESGVWWRRHDEYDER